MSKNARKIDCANRRGMIEYKCTKEIYKNTKEVHKYKRTKNTKEKALAFYVRAFNVSKKIIQFHQR